MFDNALIAVRYSAVHANTYRLCEQSRAIPGQGDRHVAAFLAMTRLLGHCF